MNRFLLIIATLLILSQGAFAKSLGDYEQEIFKNVNNFRAENNLPALLWSKQMAIVAKDHSKSLAGEKSDFNHRNASDRFNALQEIYPTMTAFGENIAYNYGFKEPAQKALDGWLKNPKHRKNILGEFTHTGVGACVDKDGKIYFTQVFGEITESPQEETSSKTLLPPHNKEMPATFTVK